MAGNSRNTRSKKSNQTSKRKPSSKRTRKKQSLLLGSKHLGEILLLIVLLFSFYLIISLYFSLGGKLGELISGAVFGLFGMGAYFIPLYFAIFSAYKLFKKDKKNLTLENNKFMVSFIFIIIASIISHIYYIKSAQIPKSIFETAGFYYTVSKMSKAYGGIVGGLIGDGLLIALGKIGASLLIALILIILFILLTEKSFIKLISFIASKIKARSKQANKNIKKKRKLRSEQRRKKKEEERLDDEFSGYEDDDRYYDKDYDNVIKENTVQKDGVIGWDFDEKVDESNYEVIGGTSFDEGNTTLDELPKKEEKTVPKDEIEPKKVVARKQDGKYHFPPLKLLSKNSDKNKVSRSAVEAKANKLVETLDSFGVDVTLLDMKIGPSVTRYELQPNIGVKVSKIVNLQDDIALSLAASGIRMEAPIPGKSAIGIEVPNDKSVNVLLRDVIESKKFKAHPSNLAVALGVDIAGDTIIADIAKMPHLLIAGATGSGKSVCINTIIISLLYKSNPDDVKIIMVDPKVVELSVYNKIPHLMIPVVTDPKKAALSLNWAVNEMNKRYKQFAEQNVRDIKGFNALAAEDEELEKMPQIVIIIDELADLMMAAPSEVETAIIRLAQMARAAGLHLIIATQRPSVNVITGLIKANVPSRIAFNVSSGVDSRTIIDSVGAEKLLGKGDMLFSPVGMQKPLRVQGAFVSDKEVKSIVDFIKVEDEEEHYDEKVAESIYTGAIGAADTTDDRDEHFEEAVKLVIKKDKASASMLQRYFRIGYNRAARLMDELSEMGIVSESDGSSKGREVLVTLAEYEEMKNKTDKSE